MDAESNGPQRHTCGFKRSWRKTWFLHWKQLFRIMSCPSLYAFLVRYETRYKTVRCFQCVLTGTAIPVLLIWQVVGNFATVPGEFWHVACQRLVTFTTYKWANYKLSSTSLWKAREVMVHIIQLGVGVMKVNARQITCRNLNVASESCFLSKNPWISMIVKIWMNGISILLCTSSTQFRIGNLALSVIKTISYLVVHKQSPV